MIEVHTDTHATTVGGLVRARVRWQHDKAPTEVRIELRWFTEGRGTTNSATVDRVVVDAAQGPIPPEVEATLTVPTAGPLTYDGVLVRVRWEVRATLDVSWARDPVESVPLVVHPYVVGGA